MTAQIILQQTPDAAALLHRRAHLNTIRGALAEREADLAHLRARLKSFEADYLRRVGILYAELDDLEARIAEREVDLYDSDSARRRAQEARRRAQQTHDAAASAAREPEEFDPPPSLKTLFREVARRIHPDLAADAADAAFYTALMMRANEAYSRGDTETLQRLLDDHAEVHASSPADGAASVSLRIERQIRQAERDIAALDAEEEMLLTSEIGLLQRDADDAAREDRDLLAELAATLHAQIADAQYRFDFLDRQMNAHGK